MFNLEAVKSNGGRNRTQHMPRESSEFGYLDQELQRKGVTFEAEASEWFYN